MHVSFTMSVSQAMTEISDFSISKLARILNLEIIFAQAQRRLTLRNVPLTIKLLSMNLAFFFEGEEFGENTT